MDPVDLAKLLDAIRQIVREEIAAAHKPIPADLSEKRRAAALARWSAEKPAKRGRKSANAMQLHASAMQKDASASTWMAYHEAYVGRYRTAPVRNAMVNSQIKQFVARVGAEEAPAVARWYVQSNVARRVAAKHSTGLLLMDAEGIRTEWAMGRDVTHQEATMQDRTQANGNVWGKLISEVQGAK